MNLSDLPLHLRKQVAAQLVIEAGMTSPAARHLDAERRRTDREHLENQFLHILACQGDHFPAPVRQYQFAKPRKWAFDFSWVDQKVAVEIDGGLHIQGRHQRPEGFTSDQDKMNQAALMGWRVGRFGASHLEDLSVLRWLEEALEKQA